MRRAEGVGIVEFHPDRVRDAVEVTEQARLQHRVQDGGVGKTGSAGMREVSGCQGPGMLRHADGQTRESPDGGIGMTRRHGTRVDHHRARERVIVESGTQKLCVSGRSIEALIEPRRRGGHELPMRP